jgi:hypothetical protein
MFLLPSWEVQGFMFCVSKLMSFCHLLFNFLVSGLTSCYWLMALASWWTWSLLIPFKQIWFHMQFHLVLWGDYNDCDLHIERTKLWLTPNTCISNFYHQCVNMAWSAKGTHGLALSILHALYRQKVLVVFQRPYFTFILRCVVIICEGFSRLIILSSFFFFFFLIWFLWLVGVLKHHLFFFPLCDPLLIFLFHLDLQLCLFSSFPPLLGALFNGAYQGFIINLPDFFSHPIAIH